MAENSWRAAFATVTGTSHERNNLECQDASDVRILPSAGGDILAIVVSDGAGSAKRSAIGSGFAVDSILDQAATWIAEKRTVAEIDRGQMCEWIEGIREQIADCAGEYDETMRDFACTLLVAILGPDHAVFAHIGDGAIVALTPANDWACVFWPKRGEYANTTYFVTDDEALQNLQFESRCARVDEVAVFTDGIEPLVLEYAEKRPFQPFFARMMKPLRASRACGADVALSRQLASYLKSPGVTAKADDDLTLVLATLRDDPPVEPKSQAKIDGGDVQVSANTN